MTKYIVIKELGDWNQVSSLMEDFIAPQKKQSLISLRVQMLNLVR